MLAHLGAALPSPWLQTGAGRRIVRWDREGPLCSSAAQLPVASPAGGDTRLLLVVLNVHCKTTLLNEI